MKKISDTELDIMMLVWEAGKAVTADDILAEVEENRWKKTSVLTFLSRLTDKGYLRCEKDGKRNSYEPLISYQEFTKAESKNVLEKMYQNSLKNFVAALYDGDGLGKKDIAELKEYLDSL